MVAQKFSVWCLRPWPQTALLFVLALAFLLPGIGEPTGLTGKDEFYLGLRTPMEMMEGDHWLVPLLDDAPRLKKPPLLYWLGRAAFEVVGPSLVSARAVGVLFAALLVVATAGVARRLLGDSRRGLVAGAIVLGCLGLFTEGRRFMLDVPVAALSVAAFWAFLVWLEARRWPWLTVAAFLLAAGFLCKGPVVGVVFGGGLAAWLLTGQGRAAGLRAHVPALAFHAGLTLCLALPWFVLARMAYPEAAQAALADEISARQFFHLSPEIFLGLLNVALPWGFVFLAAAWRERQSAGTPRLLLLWFLLTLAPFFFLRSFDRYLVGSLAPLAIFLAHALPGPLPRWAWRAGAGVALLLGGALAAFAAWFGLGGWPWLVLPMAYLAWAWWRERGLGHVLAAPAFFWLALLAGLFPALGVNAVPPEVVALGERRVVAFFDGPQPAMLPILSRHSHRHYARLDRFDLAELAALDALVFVAESDAPALRQAAADGGFEALAAGGYQTLASHGSGLRFARPGATLDDWRAAFASRRLEPLMTSVRWFSLRRQP